MQNLDNVKKYILALKDSVAVMESEIEIAEKKQVFAYPRSKNIRNEALKVAKNAKNVRDACLTLFKAGEEAK